MSERKLNDAHLLHTSTSFDTALYLCGYAVELALKYRVTKHCKWSGFPEQNNEFGKRKCLKTHDYETLLYFTGDEDEITTNYFSDWSIVEKWGPELRYQRVGTATQSDSQSMIQATQKIRDFLCR